MRSLKTNSSHTAFKDYAYYHNPQLPYVKGNRLWWDDVPKDGKYHHVIVRCQDRQVTHYSIDGRVIFDREEDAQRNNRMYRDYQNRYNKFR